MTGPGRRRVVVFARVPVAGRVKTRLAAGIGVVSATWWYRHASARLLRGLVRDSRWETWIAITPDADARLWRRWPRGTRYVSQGGGDLGARLARALERGMPASVMVVGSDVPGLLPRHVWAAFRGLRGARWTLGPSPDGGFWGIGRRGEARKSGLKGLASVRWSSPYALEDTRTRLAASGGTVAVGETLEDVDTVEDLRRWRAGDSGKRRKRTGWQNQHSVGCIES